MTTWAPARRDTLDALAAEILHNYPRGRVVVAIDGAAGSGKAALADDLSAAISRVGHAVVRASVDDFHRPLEARHSRGENSAEGGYRDSYDYDALRERLLRPFAAGKNFEVASFDLLADEPVDPTEESADPDSILVIDGIFLNRPELRGAWNFSVWLDVPDELAAQRMSARDGVGIDDPLVARSRDAQEVYRAEAAPRTRATAIIDNADPDHPRRVFADSC